MISAAELELRKRYWTRVRECLIRFHNLSSDAAKELVTDYRKRFPLKSLDPEVELIYHYEPFRIACEITGNSLMVKDFAKKYRELLAETHAVNSSINLPSVGDEIRASIKPFFIRSGSEKENPQNRKKSSGKKQVPTPAAKSEGTSVRERGEQLSGQTTGGYKVGTASIKSRTTKRVNQTKKKNTTSPKLFSPKKKKPTD